MLRLTNAEARALFLARHGLADPPAGPGKGADLMQVIRELGFVQVDSVRTVERAHHMILRARRPAYHPRNIAAPLERDRALFEHWTHDASVIPMEFWPHWRLRFARDAARLRHRWEKERREGFGEKLDQVMEHVRAHGPVTSAEVGAEEARSSGGWWDWHPSKTALEYLWRAGDLSVTRRENFRKVYDLTDRVIPDQTRAIHPTPEDSIDWLCNAALDRLGFATSGEIAAFWAIVTPAEARDWCQRQLDTGALEPVEVTCVDGSLRRHLARPGLRDTLPESLPKRLRILSPFDPALRDRTRAERLFGFRYRIEIFTPAHKRDYGYYVFPMLEGDRLTGRIDISADRLNGALNVTALWPERGVKWGGGRQARLEAELDRMARFATLETVTWSPGWLRDPA